MAKEYPKGAIQTINELLEHRGKKLYHVSRTFSKEGISRFNTELFTGKIGVKHRTENKETKEPEYWYEWYECIHEGNHRKSTHSLVDANVMENGYNDWYLFPNREDAEAYLEGDDLDIAEKVALDPTNDV